ncbi:hypothetical protein BGZ60DRAFT_534421 [Tricladium varicosporioides]|nr:hypothetical protein BGZ60DRAFT_534421 [Hymenoscyphus varicosporioides]
MDYLPQATIIKPLPSSVQVDTFFEVILRLQPIHSIGHLFYFCVPLVSGRALPIVNPYRLGNSWIDFRFTISVSEPGKYGLQFDFYQTLYTEAPLLSLAKTSTNELITFNAHPWLYLGTVRKICQPKDLEVYRAWLKEDRGNSMA